MRYRFLRFPQGKEKCVTLSYDDGTIYDKRLIETANQNRIKVTLNINSSGIGKDLKLTADDLKEIEKQGHEIAVHGDDHIAPGVVSPVHGIKDVLFCRQSLEKLLGKIIRGMAYPDCGITKIENGADKDTVKRYLKDLGIAYARSLYADNDRFELPHDFYEWIPTAHHQNTQIFKFIDNFINSDIEEYCANRSPWLFYLWGHSFEFEHNKNWDLLEEICEKLGNNKKIWYATNIEICDYVNAYGLLRFNVDNNICYNPTCTKIWFEADGQIYSVNPSETIEI